MENKTFLVDYINLFDKVYVITSNSNNEFNFLETFIVNGERKYKMPDTDTTILNRSREEIIDVNKNNFMKAYIDYLNESMQKGKFQSKEDILNDINRFKGFINSDPKLRDFLYFQDALEQIKVRNNIDEMVKHFGKKFKKEEEKKEEAKEEAKKYIETNNVIEATLDNGEKIAVSNNENNKAATVIHLNKNENLEDIIAETKVDGDYANTDEVITSMADNKNISAYAEKPEEIDKNDTLATQVAYHENKYNNGDMLAVVDSTDKNNFADNIVIDKKTGEVSEVATYNDNSLYLNGTKQSSFSTTPNSISSTTNSSLNVNNIDVEDENNPIPEFEELESLYNNNDNVDWTNKVEYLYETNREKWEEYMAYHDEKQEELNKNRAPQKRLGEDPRAAFIDISIIALITSIVGTSSLLAILINLM